MRIVSDTLRFCTAEMPRWHPISVSGYHIREAGSTAAQELAFTLANGFAYVESGVAAGLEVDDGIVTDQYLRTSDPDIYAAGDVASSVNPLLDRRIRVEHWANALNGGKSVARAMLGQDAVYDRVPYFYSDQYDLGMEYSGYVDREEGYDSVVFRGDPSIADGKAPEFLAFWVKRGRVLAGMNANVWDVQNEIQALVRAGYAGKSVDLTKLANSEVPLAEVVGD